MVIVLSLKNPGVFADDYETIIDTGFSPFPKTPVAGGPVTPMWVVAAPAAHLINGART